jgi:hypothetical protein
VIAETLEQLDITKVVAKLKADTLARGLLDVVNEDRQAAMDGLTSLVECLTKEERARLQAAIQNSTRSTGRLQLIDFTFSAHNHQGAESTPSVTSPI